MKYSPPLLLLLLALSVAHAQEKSVKKPQPTAATPTAAATTPKPAAPKPPVTVATPIPAEAVPFVPFDLSSEEAPREFAERFFAALKTNNVDGAYDVLTKGSRIAARPEEIKALKAKTREALDVFGPIVGFQLIDSKSVGDRLLRRTYLSLGRDFPLRWRFYFYKPENTWRLVDLRVDDRLAGIFEEPEEPRSPEPRP